MCVGLVLFWMSWKNNWVKWVKQPQMGCLLWKLAVVWGLVVLAPVLMVDDNVHSRLTLKDIPEIIHKYKFDE